MDTKTALSDVVIPNRILALEGVLDGFGHCSVRDPRDQNRYLMSRSLAPALVTADIVQHGRGADDGDRSVPSLLY